MATPIRYPIGQNMQPVSVSYPNHIPQMIPGPMPGSVVVTVMRPPGGPPLMSHGSIPMVQNAMPMMQNSATLGAVQVEFGGANPGPPPPTLMLPSGPSSSLIPTSSVPRLSSDLGKCKSFLETLLKLASAPNQPQDMQLRVRALVQDIVVCPYLLTIFSLSLLSIHSVCYHFTFLRMTR